MNKLKTSTKVLIIMAVTALILAVVLFFTMPEPWAQKISEQHALIMSGDFSHQDFEGMEMFHGNRGINNYRNSGRYHNPHSFGGLILVGLIIFLVFRRKKFHGRTNHSRSILDGLYAEEKISGEEYRRKRIVLEEEGK